MRRYIKLTFLFVPLICNSGCIALAAGALAGAGTYAAVKSKENRVDSEVMSVKHLQQENQYKKIAVGVASNDITVSGKIEHEFADQLAKEGVYCTPISGIFLSGQAKDGEQLKNTLVSNGTEALLIVQLAGTGEEQNYVPPVAWSSASGSGSVYGYGNLYQGLYLQGQAQQSGFSIYRGGHYVSRPWTRFNLTLIDSSKEQIVWTGISVTTGGKKSKLEDYIKVGVTEAVKKLKEDGVIKVTQN